MATGVLENDYYKRLRRVTEGVTRLKPSSLNGHECRVLVKICNTWPVMVTSPYEWKILKWDKNHKQLNNKQMLIIKSFFQQKWELLLSRWRFILLVYFTYSDISDIFHRNIIWFMDLNYCYSTWGIYFIFDLMCFFNRHNTFHVIHLLQTELVSLIQLHHQIIVWFVEMKCPTL